MRTGTRPIRFQKVQHYAFISPEFFLTSLHSTRGFLIYRGLSNWPSEVPLGIVRGGPRGPRAGEGWEGEVSLPAVPSRKWDGREEAWEQAGR